MQKIVLSNMADLRINYYEGTCETFYANISCGERESIFLYDGKCTERVECGVVSLYFFENCEKNKINVTLKIDEEQIEIVLEKSPYEEVFMADLQKIVNSSDEIQIVEQASGEKASLQKTSKSFKVNYKKAIKLAVEYFDDVLNGLYFNNKLNAECYLKVLAKKGYEQIFWYFSIIDISGVNYSMLINVNTGEIVGNKK